MLCVTRGVAQSPIVLLQSSKRYCSRSDRATTVGHHRSHRTRSRDDLAARREGQTTEHRREAVDGRKFGREVRRPVSSTFFPQTRATDHNDEIEFSGITRRGCSGV